MSLVEHAIWYQIYPLGALGAPIRDPEEGLHHRLAGLDLWLDHAVTLGCSGLLLGPIFASSTHGYDTLDHYRIDPRLGDDADFDHLMAQARERGLSVMLDGVFNHVGSHHGLVAERSPMLAWRDGDPVAWEGHGDLVELDHTNPGVADWVVGIMTHWLRRGIAGWRLDAAYSVQPDFWATVTDRVRKEFPDAIFLAEMIHGDYAAFAEASHVDAVTGYELWKAAWSSVRDVNFWELAHALERHDAFSRRTVLNTFAGNHDVDRVASLAGPAGAALAAATVFLLPGMPAVYYGDEEAFTGLRGEGYHADDAVRPALPASPDDLSPLGSWMFRLYQDLIGLRRRHPWLAEASIDIVDKANDWITWACVVGDDRVVVTLSLVGTPTIEAHFSEGESFQWSAGR